MEFRDTPEEATFRAEVRSLVQAHFPEGAPEVDPYESDEQRAQTAGWRRVLRSVAGSRPTGRRSTAAPA